MFRLYAQYEQLAVRTGRRYSSVEKALDVANKIEAKVVEVRELLPSGKERLVDIVVRGRGQHATATQ